MVTDFNATPATFLHRMIQTVQKEEGLFTVRGQRVGESATEPHAALQ